jgi:hypothetical protein
MAQYVKGLVRSGRLPEDDILNLTENLEDSSFSLAEMIKVLTDLAASPADGRPAVTLTLPLDDVLKAHGARSRKAGELPGRAGTLLKLAQNPEYEGPVTISKPDSARALAGQMLADLDAAEGGQQEGATEGGQQATEAVLKDRPLPAFVLNRIVPPVPPMTAQGQAGTTSLAWFPLQAAHSRCLRTQGSGLAALAVWPVQALRRPGRSPGRRCVSGRGGRLNVRSGRLSDGRWSAAHRCSWTGRRRGARPAGR